MIYILLSSIQQNIYLKCIEIHQCAWQHQWELKNTPNLDWIVGFKITMLHKKSIKIKWDEGINHTPIELIFTYISCWLLKCLSWIELSICSWHLMQHIETSNGSMDWHKYPKSRTSIRTGQPETLDSTKCHTFPGFRGKALDILWHASTLQFFCAKCFNWDAGLHKQFYCDTGPAFARQSDLHTSQSTWRLAEGWFGTTSLGLAPTGWLPG